MIFCESSYGHVLVQGFVEFGGVWVIERSRFIVSVFDCGQVSRFNE